MTELEWMNCENPFSMLRHVDGKLADAEFMQFSVRCCRRIWAFLSDNRSRAVVEATEAYLAGTITSTSAAHIVEIWERAYQASEVVDLAGDSTHAAIESVCGLGFGHAAQVACACFETAGFAAAHRLRARNLSDEECSAAWRSAELAERVAQCQLLRELFGYRAAAAPDARPEV